MKKFIIGSANILLAGIMAVSCSTKADDLATQDVDLSAVKDGSYKGSYRWGRTDLSVYFVTTTVKDHKIKKIDLQFNEKMTTRYTRSAKKIIDTIIAKQTPKVDVITGATLTSRQYMKAVENSLLKPEN